MRKKRSRLITALSLLLCLALVLSSCQAPQQPPEEPDLPEEVTVVDDDYDYDEAPDTEEYAPARPGHTDFLWEVIGGVGRVYLMGTMHLVSNDYILTPELLDIFDEMDALALEVDMLDFAALRDLMDLYFFPEGETILDHLSERGQAHLLNMVEAYGMELESILTTRPFALSSSFMVAALEQSDFNAIVGGVDLLLNLRAWEQDMPVYVLEDARAVLTSMNNLPADSQERIMVLTIPPPEQMVEEVLNLYEMFLSGDYYLILEFLMAESEEEEYFLGGDGLPIEFLEIDELYHYYLLEHRDRIMADNIIAYLESGENVFVAAGLAHFLGENSIIYFLEQAGYQVVRVDLRERAAQAV